MYDATGGNATGLLPFNPAVVAGYDTGSAGIAWVPPTWAMFPSAIHVHIDQGGAGAPVRSAKIWDVEPNAWSPSDIPGLAAASTCPHPGVYCDRNDLPAVLAVWSGPIWLAWPGWAGEPVHPQVVMVQNVFAAAYDATRILNRAFLQAAEADMFRDILHPSAQVPVPFPAGAFTRLYLYHDFGGTHRVRVAVHSVSAGYTVHDLYDVNHSVPQEITFAHADTDAVSLVSEADVPIGWTLA
jgi:hypothetical protein